MTINLLPILIIEVVVVSVIGLIVSKADLSKKNIQPTSVVTAPSNQNQLNSLQENYNNLRNELTEKLEALGDGKDSKNEELSKNIEDIETILLSKVDEITALQSEINKIQTKLQENNTEAQFKVLTDTEAELKLRITKLEEEIAKLNKEAIAKTETVAKDEVIVKEPVPSVGVINGSTVASDTVEEPVSPLIPANVTSTLPVSPLITETVVSPEVLPEIPVPAISAPIIPVGDTVQSLPVTQISSNTTVSKNALNSTMNTSNSILEKSLALFAIAQANNDHSAKELEDLKTSLNNLQEEKTRLEKELEDFKKIPSNINLDTNSNEQRIKNLDNNIDKLNNDLQDALQINKLQDEATQTAENFAVAAKEVVQQNASVGTSYNANAQANIDMATQSEISAKASSALADALAEVERKTLERMASIEIDLQTYEENLKKAAVDRVTEASNEKLNELENQTKYAQTELEALKLKLKNVNDTLAQNELKAISLENSKNHYDTLEKDRILLQSQLEDMNIELEAAKEKSKSVKLDAIKEAEKKAQDELNEKIEKLKELQDKINERSEDLGSIEEQQNLLASIQSEVNTAKTELVNLTKDKVDMNNLSQELSKLKDTLTSEQRKLDETILAKLSAEASAKAAAELAKQAQISSQLLLKNEEIERIEAEKRKITTENERIEVEKNLQKAKDTLAELEAKSVVVSENIDLSLVKAETRSNDLKNLSINNEIDSNTGTIIKLSMRNIAADKLKLKDLLGSIVSVLNFNNASIKLNTRKIDTVNNENNNLNIQEILKDNQIDHLVKIDYTDIDTDELLPEIYPFVILTKDFGKYTEMSKYYSPFKILKQDKSKFAIVDCDVKDTKNTKNTKDISMSIDADTIIMLVMILKINFIELNEISSNDVNIHKFDNMETIEKDKIPTSIVLHNRTMNLGKEEDIFNFKDKMFKGTKYNNLVKTKIIIDNIPIVENSQTPIDKIENQTALSHSGGGYITNEIHINNKDLNKLNNLDDIDNSIITSKREINPSLILINPIILLALLKIIRIIVYYNCTNISKAIVIDLAISFTFIIFLYLFVSINTIEFLLYDLFISFLLISLVNLLFIQKNNKNDKNDKKNEIHKKYKLLIVLLILIPYFLVC